VGHWRDENVYSILVHKPEWKRPLGRSSHRWKNNIKMGLKKWFVRLWTGFV